ncbi:MAG: DUF861 domain-containing protein [Candidatus Kerfeldbacteria bacterium]|nr:DUF861 domain-containing protein [Candidatus Kerfeldbacteria bacterium]
MKATRKQAHIKKKHGIKLWVYPAKQKVSEVAYIESTVGHLQEFYDKKSTFTYYILAGQGTFYLNGKAVPVKATDVVIIPPMTKIYYIGKMKMTLTTSPVWNAKNEVHVRFIRSTKHIK